MCHISSIWEIFSLNAFGWRHETSTNTHAIISMCCLFHRSDQSNFKLNMLHMKNYKYLHTHWKWFLANALRYFPSYRKECTPSFFRTLLKSKLLFSTTGFSFHFWARKNIHQRWNILEIFRDIIKKFYIVLLRIVCFAHLIHPIKS